MSKVLRDYPQIKGMTSLFDFRWMTEAITRDLCTLEFTEEWERSQRLSHCNHDHKQYVVPVTEISPFPLLYPDHVVHYVLSYEYEGMHVIFLLILSDKTDEFMKVCTHSEICRIQ